MKRIILITSLVLLFIGGVILFAPSKTVLVISNRKNSNQRLYSDLAYKNGFIISYTHSVNKGRVHDFYKCDQKEEALILQSTHFVSYGAGIPEPEETPGATFIALDNCYIISNINSPYRFHVLVAAAGQADQQQRVLRQRRRAPDRLGDRVARLQRRDYPLVAAERVERRHRLRVVDRHVLGAPGVVEVAVLRSDAGVVEPGRDRIRVDDVAVGGL